MLIDRLTNQKPEKTYSWTRGVAARLVESGSGALLWRLDLEWTAQGSRTEHGLVPSAPQDEREKGIEEEFAGFRELIVGDLTRDRGLFCVAGAGAAPVTGPMDPRALRAQLAKELGGAGLGISVRLTPPIGVLSMNPETVYFVRLDDSGSLLQESIFPSSHCSGYRCYAYDVAAGTYAVVAAHYNLNGGGDLTLFSGELVERTKGVVGKKDFAFLGHHSVYLGLTTIGADPVQKHYAQRLTLNALFRLLTHTTRYRGLPRKTENDEASATKFPGSGAQGLKTAQGRGAASASRP